MKKIITLITILLLLCGCSNSKEKTYIPKTYNLSYYGTIDCNIDSIEYFDTNGFFISNGTGYKYSKDKKFSETNNNCKKIDLLDKNIKFIGINVVSNHLLTDGNKLFTFSNSEGDGAIELSSSYFNGDYKNYELYYNFYNIYEIKNDTIIYNNPSNNEKATVVVPSSEKIINVMYYPMERNLFIKTNKNVYEIAVKENDDCLEYVDKACTYVLKKSNRLDELLNDYKDDIKYIDGSVLITKDNKIYNFHLERE